MASTGVSRISGVDPSVAIKAPCYVATTGNITLSGAQTIDGVSVSETTIPTRVLVWKQTDAKENGIYDVKGTAWVRSEDFNGNRDVVKGTLVNVQLGSTYEGYGFRVSTSDPVTINTSEINFAVVDTVGAYALAVEQQTAIDSQTLFTLTTMTYANGAGVLSVYVNGVLAYPEDYNETSSSSVTFLSGLEAGDKVLFEARVSSFSVETVDSSNVPITIDGAVTNASAAINTLWDTVYTNPLAVADGPVELIAHRGYKNVCFENTLLALSYAENKGADSLEMDASISSDGVWYLFHDTTVDALTDGTGTFTSLTSTYLDTLEISSAVGTPYEGIGLTKLDNALNFLRETGMKAYIEIKNVSNGTTQVDSFMQKLDSYGLLDKAHIQSNNTIVIARARLYSATAEIGYIVDSTDPTTAVNTALAAGANAILNAYGNYISVPTTAATYRAAGIEPIAYTPNKRFEFDRLTAVGVRKIISDSSTIK